jgi:hypothetical protein
MSDNPPKTIAELYYLLDKRLSLLEALFSNHNKDHEEIQKDLDDHESRLRSGLTFSGILTGSGGLLSLIAILKAFLK